MQWPARGLNKLLRKIEGLEICRVDHLEFEIPAGMLIRQP